MEEMKIYRMKVSTEEEGEKEIVVLAPAKLEARKLLQSKTTLKLCPELEGCTVEKITEIKVSSKAKILLIA